MKLKSLLALLLAAVMLLGLLAGCGKKTPPEQDPSSEEPSLPERLEYPVELGEYRVLARPRRVVSLSPALTEKLYDLGLEDRLAGVSDYCDYPAEAGGLPRCGTAELPDLEKIDDIGTHMVISETPLDPEDLEQLREWEIDVVVFSHAQSLQDLYDSYLGLCRVMEGEYAGGEMGEKFVAGLDALVSRIRQAVSSEERKNALYIRKLPFTLATGDTLENDLFGVIGLDNVMAEETGWAIDEEKATGEARAKFESVQVMFFDPNDPDFPVRMKEDLEKSAFYKGLPATLKDWYLEIDNQIMERQSLRTFRQLLDMAAYAHPEASLPPFQLGGGAARPSSQAEDTPEEEPEAGESEAGS